MNAMPPGSAIPATIGVTNPVVSPSVTGGYDTSTAGNALYGTPTAALLYEIQFVDAAIGEFISERKKSIYIIRG
jgi:hypothetical protein